MTIRKFTISGRAVAVHPLAACFPLVGKEGLAALADDIKAYGQRQSVILAKIDDTEYLIDGRNRLLACEIARLEPTVETLAQDLDPMQYIVSANVHRRHLTPSQKALAAARMTTAKGPGRPSKNAPIGAISQALAAQMMGVGRSALQRAVAILGDAILPAAVDDGIVSVHDAYEARGATEAQKRSAVEAVRKGGASTLAEALASAAAADASGAVSHGVNTIAPQCISGPAIGASGSAPHRSVDDAPTTPSGAYGGQNAVQKRPDESPREDTAPGAQAVLHFPPLPKTGADQATSVSSSTAPSGPTSVEIASGATSSVDAEDANSGAERPDDDRDVQNLLGKMSLAATGFSTLDRAGWARLTQHFPALVRLLRPLVLAADRCLKEASHETLAAELPEDLVPLLESLLRTLAKARTTASS